MSLVVALLLNAFALLITAYIVPGFQIRNFLTAILAALVIGFINTFIKPVLSKLTAPLNMVSLGLFTFVINAIILYLASLLVPGFELEGATAAILGAVVLTIVATILSVLVKEVKRVTN